MPQIRKPAGIPAARLKLRVLIAELMLKPHPLIEDLVPRLHAIEQSMYRKPPIRKAKAKAKRITTHHRMLVKELFEKHPDWHQQDIAFRVGINSGRVSEILNGLR